VLPCLILEDEHLLVVNKPAGLNTHAPSPYAGEGLYDWLRHREPRWSKLAIIQRLDKETSGVIVFSKSLLANRALTSQFTNRSVRKKYLLLTDRPVPAGAIHADSSLARAGEKYVSRHLTVGGERAETHFRLVGQCETTGQGREGENPQAEPRRPKEAGGWRPELRSELGEGKRGWLVEAEPLTGRTHQIRVHAAEKGFPILGDTLYGGTPAARVYLHAAELILKHPASDQELTFRAPLEPRQAGVSGGGPIDESEGLEWLAVERPGHALRHALMDPEQTNAYREVHGASDGWPGWYVDRLGHYLLSQSEHDLQAAELEELARLVESFSARGAYHRILTRHARRSVPAEVSPQLVLGAAAPERFTVRENGLCFELSFAEGYSVGLFLDQRDNRRRLLSDHIAAGFPLLSDTPGAAMANGKWQMLNTFAYTCGFSVCAAKAGARTTNLDLSRKSLAWGKRNFELNQLDSTAHEFLQGDVFAWLRRLGKKQRLFDVVLLDPPTFSQSKESGVFRADKDYGRLVTAALPLLKSGGVLFASTNAADWPPEEFMATLAKTIRGANRSLVQQHYFPQPPDFPISRTEPAYLKTVWLRVK
jgi:23S rRNA (cytosine1962-C5)-methyltransferase